MAPEIIAQRATSHSNHFNQIEFLHSTGLELLVQLKASEMALLQMVNPS
jgi:hypothetical protein